MLTIREPQMQSLRGGAERQFEDDMVAHLHAFAPRHCAVIGEPWVRETIRTGRSLASRYGFNRRGPVRFYIELMFLLGGHFDTDRQLPWAAETLSGGTSVDQMERAERLFDRSREYLRQVAGPGNAYAIAAMRALRQRAAEPISFQGHDIEDRLLVEMRLIYPERYVTVSEPALRMVIRDTRAMGASLSAHSGNAAMLLAVLAFALGHRFHDDPLFPWIQGTLRDPRIQAPEERMRRLGRKAITYLDHALASLAACRT